MMELAYDRNRYDIADSWPASKGGAFLFRDKAGPPVEAQVVSGYDDRAALISAGCAALGGSDSRPWAFVEGYPGRRNSLPARWFDRPPDGARAMTSSVAELKAGWTLSLLVNFPSMYGPQ